MVDKNRDQDFKKLKSFLEGNRENNWRVVENKLGYIETYIYWYGNNKISEKEKQLIYQNLINIEIELKKELPVSFYDDKIPDNLDRVGNIYRSLDDHESAYEVFRYEEKLIQKEIDKVDSLNPQEVDKRVRLGNIKKRYQKKIEKEAQYLEGGKSHNEKWWEEHRERVRRLKAENGLSYGGDQIQDSMLTPRKRGKHSFLERLAKGKHVTMLLMFGILIFALSFQFSITGNVISNLDSFNQNKPLIGVVLLFITALMVYLISNMVKK